MRTLALRILRPAVLLLPLLALAGCPVPVETHEPVLSIPEVYRPAPEQPGQDWLDTYARLAPDVQTAAGARRAGIDRMTLLVKIAQALLEEFEIDESSSRFIDQLDGGFLEFDVHELYRSFPYGEEGGRREIVFVGRLVEDRYKFGLAEPSDLTKLAPGDLYSRIRLTPIEHGALGDAAYDLDGEMGIHTGLAGGAEGLEFVVETLRGMQVVAEEPEGPATAGEPASKSLQGEDWRLLASLERAYPLTYSWINEFFRIEDLLEKKPAPEPLALKARFGPRIEAFEGKYPRLHSLLSSTELSFRTSGAYLDEAGHEWIRHSLASDDYLIRLNGLLDDGGLRPMDSRGNPAPGEPLRLGAGSVRGQAVYEAQASYSGLQLILVGLRSDVQLVSGEEGFLLNYRFRNPPKVARIDGKLYGVIPDWLMMVDFDDLFRSLLQTAVQGRGGRGTEIGVSWRRQSEGANLLKFRVQSELPAEGVLRYVYKFWKRRFLPSFGQPGERSRFQNRFLSNLILDLAAGKEATRE